MKKKSSVSHHAIASGINAELNAAIGILGGKDEGDPLKTRQSRTKARKANEEVTTNAISTGNIATYDPVLSGRPMDPRLKRMLDSMNGAETPAKKAVRDRVIMSWNRLHGGRTYDNSQSSSGDM